MPGDFDSSEYFSDLNSFENIARIVRRLPFSLQTSWTRSSSNIERQGCEPSFSDLYKVVKSSYATALQQKV